MSRLTNDLTAVRAMFGPGVLHAVNTVYAYAIAVPLMVHIDPVLTVLALLPYPVLLLGARRFARAASTPAAAGSSKRSRRSRPRCKRTSAASAS
jgi:ATP-binding cassette subfamily B multidrug efflux pump